MPSSSQSVDLELQPRDFLTLFRPRGSVSILMALFAEAPASPPQLLRHELDARISGVPCRVISSTLDSLEDAGLVKRRLCHERPFYSLTEAGFDVVHLLPLLANQVLHELLREAVVLRDVNKKLREQKRDEERQEVAVRRLNVLDASST